jgi:hypothetical protein
MAYTVKEMSARAALLLHGVAVTALVAAVVSKGSVDVRRRLVPLRLGSPF